MTQQCALRNFLVRSHEDKHLVTPKLRIFSACASNDLSCANQLELEFSEGLYPRAALSTSIPQNGDQIHSRFA